MTLGEIISRAASAYPDAYILTYWDQKNQCAVPNRVGGDKLAEFIAFELEETYDPDADDKEQLDTAIEKMRSAAADLQSVVAALENMAAERKD